MIQRCISTFGPFASEQKKHVSLEEEKFTVCSSKKSFNLHTYNRLRPTFFRHKRLAPYTFCVSNCKIIAVTRRNSYLVPQINGYIYILGRVTLVSNHGEKKGYESKHENTSRDKIGLPLHHGLYRFLCSSFSSICSPGNFLQNVDVLISS